MIKIIREITLDFYDQSYVKIQAKQNDAMSRYVKISCLNNGSQVILDPDRDNVMLRYKKSDGACGLSSCDITEDGCVLAELTEQMLSSPGFCKADVFISDTANSILTILEDGTITINPGSVVSTMNFIVDVIADPVQDSEIESSTEFSALRQLINMATRTYEEVIQKVKSYADQCKEIVDNVKLGALGSKSTPGIVKVGDNINVSAGVISVGAATSSVAGCVKVGDNISVSNGTISVPGGSLNNSGTVQLSNTPDSSNESKAATPKCAYDSIPVYMKSNIPVKFGSSRSVIELGTDVIESGAYISISVDIPTEAGYDGTCIGGSSNVDGLIAVSDGYSHGIVINTSSSGISSGVISWKLMYVKQY